MTRELSPEAIEVAAEWWTNILTAPVIHDNGDPEGFASAMANMGSLALSPLTPEQLRIFKETLKTLIIEESQQHRVVIVATDYDPCPSLLKASQAAGIESLLFRFPWKTVLWIDDRDVRVRQGYRAETKTIWKNLTEYALYNEDGSKKNVEPQNVTLPIMTKDQSDVLSTKLD